MHLKLAEEYGRLGDKKDESQTLRNVLFQLKGEDAERATVRLIELKQLDEIPAIRRRQLADRLPKELASKVLWSIASMAIAEPQRPEALLELVGLLRDNEDPKESMLAMDLLKADYPTHSVMEIAKQRGWLA